MRTKFGNDFYNKIKVNLLMSNQKTGQEINHFKKFLEIKKKYPEIPQKVFERKQNSVFFQLNQPEEENLEKGITIQEYKKKFEITPEDDYFLDYKHTNLQRAKNLLKHSATNRTILSTDLTRFPYFLKKLDSQSNHSSFLENYCPLETDTQKKPGLSQNFNKIKLKLPTLTPHTRRKTYRFSKKIDDIDSTLNREENGAISERIRGYEETIYGIQEETKDFKKNSRFLKKKVRNQTKSLNGKFGKLLKNLENLI